MRIKVAAIGIALTIGLAGCGSNSNQQSLPDPVTNNYLTHQIVFTEPDGFRNVSFGCNGVDGIYVTSRGAYKNSGSEVASLPSSVAVVMEDPNCGAVGD